MSTRATYEFTGRHLPRITIYIHHDGYAEGAAFYFWNMHHCARKGSHAERFLIANERAELTQSHDVHGDTEYRYSLDGDTLTAKKRYGYNNPGESRTWHAFYVGPWWEFVNKYAHAEGFDGVTFAPLRVLPDVTVYGNGQRCVFTRAQLVAALDEKRAYLADYSARFPEHIGNIGGIKGDVRRCEENLAAFDAMDTVTAEVSA